MKRKEKREAVLYAKIKPSIKKWLKKKAKELGYTTLSEFLDEHFSDLKGNDK